MYVVMTYNGGATANFSKNGGTLASASFTCHWENTTVNYPRPLYVGGDAGYPHNGMLDEVRVSNIARSQGWITTEYNNQNAPTTFYSLTAEEAILTVSISSTINVVCNGQSTGSATASPSGGTPSYTYKWSSTPQQTTQTATNLFAIIYTVTVSDANLNTASVSVTITQLAAVAVSSSSFNPSCNGSANGSITITAGGGTPGYTFSYDNGGPGNNDYSGSGNPYTFNNLPAGIYRIRAKDSMGCFSPSVP
jgi:hypothetical protein